MSVARSTEVLQRELAVDCRVMQGLAEGCGLASQIVEGQPEVEGLLHAVAAQWARMYERLLRLSGEML